MQNNFESYKLSETHKVGDYLITVDINYGGINIRHVGGEDVNEIKDIFKENTFHRSDEMRAVLKRAVELSEEFTKKAYEI